MKNELEILDKIQRVDAPPFLFTRIESKINEVIEPVYSLKLITSMSFALLLLAFINFGSIQKNRLAKNNNGIEVNTLVKEISSSNHLYNE